MRRMILCAAVLTSLLIPIHLALGGDWPQWRGPDRNGHSSDTGLLTSWPEGGPKLVWKIQGPGFGYSSPAVTGGRHYTMGDGAGASHVLAFDAASGKPLWATRLGEAGAPGWGGFAGPRCTPTVDGDLVYALGQYGYSDGKGWVCQELESGKMVWREKRKLPKTGNLFIGTKASILASGDYGNSVRIIPEDKMKDMTSKLPKITEKHSNHSANFLLSAKGEEKTHSCFSVSGPLTQVFLLGVIAQRLGGTLEFDAKTKQITNNKIANQLLTGLPPRKGWEQYYKL
jgi:hypothetical protein